MSPRSLSRPKNAKIRRALFALLILLAFGLRSSSHDIPSATLITNSPASHSFSFSLTAIDGIDLVNAAARAATPPSFDATKPTIHAAIIPHHTLAATIITDTWKNIAASAKPSVIVIISPAHGNQGQAMVQTTHGTWHSVVGDVSTSDALVDQIVASGISSEPPSFVDEHGIGTHIPLIARFFPGVPIVPIIAKSPANEVDAKRLIAILQKVLPADAFLVSSIDFAHYLDAPTTLAHDKITEQLIADRVYPHIDFLSSAYLDTPFALDVFLLWSDSHHYPLTQTYHSSSHVLLHNPLLPGTSYFIYVS